MMEYHYGVKVIAYLDDFLVITDSQCNADHGLALLLRLLRLLGLISNQLVESGGTCSTFDISWCFN